MHGMNKRFSLKENLIIHIFKDVKINPFSLEIQLGDNNTEEK